MEDIPMYEGPERRSTHLQLDEALAEVQRLHNAATTLANAVANTAHRSELMALRDEVKKEFKLRLMISIALTTVSLLLIVFYMNNEFNDLSTKVVKGNQIITCLQGKTEVQRTGDFAGTALITCEQTTR